MNAHLLIYKMILALKFDMFFSVCLCLFKLHSDIHAVCCIHIPSYLHTYNPPFHEKSLIEEHQMHKDHGCYVITMHKKDDRAGYRGHHLLKCGESALNGQ